MLNILSFGNLVYAMTTLSFTMKTSESVLYTYAHSLHMVCASVVIYAANA